jgi:hypothetical protein
LTVNEGELSESVTTLYLGVPLANTGLCIPASNETNQDNSQAPYDGSQGWYDKFHALLSLIDTQITGQAFGVLRQGVESLGAGANEVGYLDLGMAEGIIFQVYGSITGNSDACNIEFASSAYGTPINLYEIGEDDSGNPLWDPDTDGDWNDGTPAGITGLSNGRLYYRVTNDGTNSITMTFQVRVIGVENPLV